MITNPLVLVVLTKFSIIGSNTYFRYNFPVHKEIQDGKNFLDTSRVPCQNAKLGIPNILLGGEIKWDTPTTKAKV